MRRRRMLAAFAGLLLVAGLAVIAVSVLRQPQPTGQVLGIADVIGPGARFGVAEAWRNDAARGELGIQFDRIMFAWDGIQPESPQEFRADLYFRPERLQAELDSGIEVAGLLQFTPAWARLDPSKGARSVPKNFDLPWDHPENYFARFAQQIAQHYRGRVNHWILWNEMEFQEGDAGGGQSYTWAGGTAEYYTLMKNASRAIKAGNPDAKVVMGATSYWVDLVQRPPRELFFKRVLDEAAKDPEARANGYFFDIAAWNLYRAPDDVYRVYHEARGILSQHRLDKPIWLTETNAMPHDDRSIPCPRNFPPDGARVPMSVQADYAIQAVAMAAAAGYQRINWYQLGDGGVCQEPEVWGLTRDDGSRRPAFDAMKTSLRYFKDFQSVTFNPLTRFEQKWQAPWPDNPKSYYPNWQVYQVAFDQGDRRVTVLWSGDPVPLRARIPKVGSSATLVDKAGGESALADVAGWYVVDLGPATATGPFDPAGYYYIGGEPKLIVQHGVPPGAPIAEPSLGDPGSVQAGFKLQVAPDALIANPGGQVTFELQSQSLEGFSGAISLRFKEYSTQRDPAPVGRLPGTVTLDMPSSLQPGQRGNLTVRTTPEVARGIHFISVEATAGDQSQTIDVVVQVES